MSHGTRLPAVLSSPEPTHAPERRHTEGDSGTANLTFTTQNWNVEQVVSASVGSDDNAADETLSVSHAVSGYAGVSSALAVAVEDDDAPGFAFMPAVGLSLSEGGGAEATATYALVLTAQPSGTVTVTLSSNDAGLEFDADGELTWQVSSSDPAVATVRIVDGTLVVEPQPGEEGTVLVEATATDANGLTTTIRFEVQVDFHWPPRRGGWRSALPRIKGK